MFQRRVCVNYALRNPCDKVKKRIMSFRGAYLVYVSKIVSFRLRKSIFKGKQWKPSKMPGNKILSPSKKTKSGKIAVVDLKIPSKKNRENFLLRKKFFRWKKLAFRWKKLAFLCEFSRKFFAAKKIFSVEKISFSVWVLSFFQFSHFFKKCTNLEKSYHVKRKIIYILITLLR